MKKIVKVTIVISSMLAICVGLTSCKSLETQTTPKPTIMSKPEPTVTPTSIPVPLGPTATPDSQIAALDTDIKEAYAKVLRNEYEGDVYTHFAFAYVTPDSIPELVVLRYGGEASQTYIYEYINGEAKAITLDDGSKINFGPYGVLIYKEKTGLVYSNRMRMGQADYYLYKIGNGKCEMLHSFYDDYATGIEESEATFKADGVKVTYDEYERKIAECGFFGDDLTSIDSLAVPLVTEENISIMLEN